MIKFSNRILSLILISLNLSILFGWFYGNESLITWGEDLVPVQFNTALCFIFLSVAIFFCTKRHYWITKLSVIPTIVISLLTLGQYLHGVNFGIDTALFNPWYDVNTSHPGRMAPNTALCFLFDALCLYVISRDRNNYIETAIVNTFSFSIGLLAFIGRYLGVESLYGWGDYTNMAIPTAICFLITSLAIYIDVFRKYRLYKGEIFEKLVEQEKKLHRLGELVNGR